LNTERDADSQEEIKKDVSEIDDMGLSYWQRVGAGALGGALVAIAVTNYQKFLSFLNPVPSLGVTVLVIFIGVLIIFYGRYGELPF